MPGIVIDIGGDDDGSIARKARKATESVDRIAKGMQQLAGGGLRGGVSSITSMLGMAGTSIGALAIGAATLGTAVGIGIKKAIEAGVGTEVSRYASGAMGAQVGLQEGWGSFLGGGGAQIAGMAQSLADKLRGGGLAAGWARSQGIVDLGPYTLNKIDNLTKTIEKLRLIQNEQVRMFYTRELLGAEAAPLVELSGRMYKVTKWMSEQAKLSPEQQATLGGVKAIGSQVWDWTVTGVQQMIADFFSTKFNWMNFFPSPKTFWTWDFSDLLPGSKKGGKSAEDEHTKAMREHTEALHDHTRAARTEGIHIGPRGKRAVPKAWREMVAEDAMKEQVRRLGGI